MADRGSEEHHRRISAGVSRSWQRRKARENLRPAHVDRWIRDGTVAPALIPILEVRACQAEAIIQDLGGPSEVTAMQRGILDGWFKASVAADVEFARLVRGDADAPPERLATYLNSARANLLALGLSRRSKAVVGVTSYLAERERVVEESA